MSIKIYNTNTELTETKIIETKEVIAEMPADEDNIWGIECHLVSGGYQRKDGGYFDPEIFLEEICADLPNKEFLTPVFKERLLQESEIYFDL